MVSSMLLEREAELGILGDLIANLDSTGGKIVLIRGEAGIGKSALVQRFVDSHEAEAYIHYGSCDDLFIPQPLGPFWDMARGEPSLKEPVFSGDRPRALQVVLDLLSRSTRPTIIVIEDTHWADEATLDAIRYLGRRIARTNGLLVLTYRDGEVDYDHPLRAVIGDIPPQSVVRIQLEGLSLSAVSSMVGGSALDPADVLAATRGNPLLIVEMSFGPDGDVAASLRDSVEARVARLTVGSQDMLKTLAVIPEPIPRRDALRLAAADESRLDESEQRGFLDCAGEMVAFRHDLIRRAVKSTLTQSERLAENRAVLQALPEETHPSLLVHCAREADDIDRLLVLAPRSARYAAAAGSHVQAAEDFRELGPHLDRLPPEELGPLLDEWAREEFLIDDVSEAMRLNALAREHYRESGDSAAESHALARAAHYHENAGQRERAEELAGQAVEVLGADPEGPDLARALEVNAYLHMMAGDVSAVLDLVDRTLEAGGPQIDEAILIRSLVHRGNMANIANYPDGQASLDEARDRAEAAGQWYEESRAPFLHASAAAESFDLAIASDYAHRALVSAVRHELPNLEAYAKALIARVAELQGRWDEAADLVREVLDTSAITQMVAMPVLGGIEARRGRTSAQELVRQAWDMAYTANEMQRLAPAAIAVAECAWTSGSSEVAMSDLASVMRAGLDKGFSWSSGRIAFWLWQLGELDDVPDGIAEPFRLMIAGEGAEAAAIWQARGAPYERALALMHGSQADQLEALELLEALGARAVAAKFRKELRGRGVSVPRGRGHATRRSAAGLTARQAEVLQLLGEDLSNIEIADRLFVSPRTVENHVSAVLDKLDVSTRAEAVSRAHADGLLEASS
jgi:DNA-binding CsgD family transcriptional regulator